MKKIMYVLLCLLLTSCTTQEKEEHKPKPKIGGHKHPITVLNYDESYKDKYTFQTYVSESKDNLSKMMIITEQDVKEFKIYQLTLDKITDKKIEFKKEVVYQLDTLSKDKAILAGLSMETVLPRNGISYKDSKNKVHMFAIEKSGFDDNYLLNEID